MKRKDIVLLSTADWSNPFWTNKQHVAVQLAKRGHKVFYIDSLGLRRPSASKQDISRIVRRIKRAIQPPHQVRENIWVWSPVVLPFQGYNFIRRFNNLFLNRLLGFWLNYLGIQLEILWTYNPLTTQLLDIKDYDKVVYHCVDEIKAQPGMPVATLEALEKELVRKSDIIFTTSPKLLKERKKWNSNTHYFPNVADFDHFFKALNQETVIPDDLANIPAPRIGFIGAISGYKVDFNLIRYVAEKRPDWSIVLIGQVGEGDPWTDLSIIDGIPNVFLLGPRSYKDLPKYLKGFDVALLPNIINEYTESMFPMKFFEYLASGKPVVSVDLPALQDFQKIAFLAKKTDEFVERVNEALTGDISPLKERLAVAREYTYEKRTEKMMELFENQYCGK